MAERKRASALTEVREDTPSKAALQRRMEETRESISQTVDEIKDTVSEQYETVKETVGEVLDWKEQFQKNPLVWGIGAVAVGLAVGYSMALLRQGDRHSSHRRRGSQADDFTDTVFDGLATLGQSYILPAVTHKVKELFGVDITEELLGHTRRRMMPGAGARKNGGRKRAAKKSGAKKKAAPKRAAKKQGAK
ncbi:MAG TPA: hypothetical protein VE842_13535 [Pyrinomonadaceae bacterium]|jgi:ElaB/YqjD/DUF883 family membrane-anchored ribosome-binding protein|nr:hypothetical protein [Pyrinomonadaceae bacterium]